MAAIQSDGSFEKAGLSGWVRDASGWVPAEPRTPPGYTEHLAYGATAEPIAAPMPLAVQAKMAAAAIAAELPGRCRWRHLS